MQGNVGLRPLDPDALLLLRDVAVADADPAEVVPPLPSDDGGAAGPPGWTAERRQWFVDFFTPMLDAPDITIYAITVDGAMAGFMRLKRLDQHTGETGIWLGRSWRGRGLATAALGELLREAARRGLSRVVADTLPTNAAAQGLLRAHGARLRQEAGKIYAEMTIDPGYAADLDK
ncbi:GNAT family N-acetyltransferase [Allorhizocola rhizosphaerae]|uniref:GNAT family N-acetyltransferase n=1 Tax=Allorhizocola rhizosphaerae TaxID=1872709 RepID=UPI0013C2AF52|nr:GNAT family N-acetyltransferase [Allorhizocola rhizosphaerae]